MVELVTQIPLYRLARNRYKTTQLIPPLEMAKERNEWNNTSLQAPTQYFADMQQENQYETRPSSRMTNPDPNRIYQPIP